MQFAKSWTGSGQRPANWQSAEHRNQWRVPEFKESGDNFANWAVSCGIVFETIILMKATPFFIFIGSAMLALAAVTEISPAQEESAKDVAGEKPADEAANVAGSWSWPAQGFGGEEYHARLTLKQKDAEITGSYRGGRGESAIQEGRIEGNAISFKTVRSFGDREFTTTFAGKVRDGEIQGKITSPRRDGGRRETDWHAYKDPDIDPSGLWKWSAASRRDGTQRDRWVKLSYAKGKLTGVYRTTRSQAPMKEAVLNGKEISFKVELGRGERTSTTHYKGILEEGAIKGTITVRRGGEDRRSDWAAARVTPEVEAAGRWTWTSRFGRGGEERENTLALKQEGSTLTGTMTGRQGETAIADVKLDGDRVTFKVTTENDRGSFTSDYSAKIDGDVLHGSIVMKFGQRTFERSFKASRVLPKPEPVGAWKWTTRGFGADSRDVENVLTLSMKEGKLAGIYSRGGEETSLQDAKLDKNTLTFKLQRTFRDTVTTLNYTGQFRGDVLKGHYSIGENTSGAVRLWEAARMVK